MLIRYLRTCCLNGIFIPRGWRRGYEGETVFPSKRNRSIYPAMNFTALEIVHFFLTLDATQYKRHNLKKGVMERGTETHSRKRHNSFHLFSHILPSTLQNKRVEKLFDFCDCKQYGGLMFLNASTEYMNSLFRMFRMSQ